VTGDNLTVATVTGTFDGPDAGVQQVSGTGLTLGGADAHNYTLVHDTANTTAEILRRVVSSSGSRVYDGSTDLAAEIFTLNNLVAGETLKMSGTGKMADKDAGNG